MHEKHEKTNAMRVRPLSRKIIAQNRAKYKREPGGLAHCLPICYNNKQ